MFWRFSVTLLAITFLCLVTISLEKQNLTIKRKISLQHYQLEILQEKQTRALLSTQQLISPARLARELPQGATVSIPSSVGRAAARVVPESNEVQR